MSINIRNPILEQALSFTPAAIKQIKKEMEKYAHPIGIRLHLKKAGCSGYMYRLEIIETQVDADDLYFQQELDIYVAKKDYPLLKGTSIDFVKEGLNYIFKYSNPNEKGSCGCGESFTTDESFQ